MKQKTENDAYLTLAALCAQAEHCQYEMLEKMRRWEIPEDAQKVLDLLASYAGVLPFSEKASPEVIFRETGMSKNAFKRAVGHLYKERKVTIDNGKIRLA